MGGQDAMLDQCNIEDSRCRSNVYRKSSCGFGDGSDSNGVVVHLTCFKKGLEQESTEETEAPTQIRRYLRYLLLDSSFFRDSLVVELERFEEADSLQLNRHLPDPAIEVEWSSSGIVTGDG